MIKFFKLLIAKMKIKTISVKELEKQKEDLEKVLTQLNNIEKKLKN